MAGGRPRNPGRRPAPPRLRATASAALPDETQPPAIAAEPEPAERASQEIPVILTAPPADDQQPPAIFLPQPAGPGAEAASAPATALTATGSAPALAAAEGAEAIVASLPEVEAGLPAQSPQQEEAAAAPSVADLWLDRAVRVAAAWEECGRVLRESAAAAAVRALSAGEAALAARDLEGLLRAQARGALTMAEGALNDAARLAALSLDLAAQTVRPPAAGWRQEKS